MLKQSLFAAFLVGGCLTATADDLRSTAINNAATADKVKADVTSEAKDSLYWKFPCKVGMNFGQTAYNDYWAEANVNSITFNLYGDFQANYKKGRKVWNNELYGEYGVIYSSEYEQWHTRKNLDKLTFTSKYGYQSQKLTSLYYSALLDLKTQIYAGYDYVKNEGSEDVLRVLNSEFFAPANMIGSLGLEYVPNKYVSVFFSPITGRAVFCANDALLEKCGLDSTNEKIGSVYYKVEPGLYFRVLNEFEIVKNVILTSKFDYFYAYYGKYYGSDLKHEDDEWFGSMKHHSVINWDLLLTMKVNSYINASVRGQLKWEYPVVEHWQCMDAITVGFSYNF